jgi:hypothetical protein
MNNLKQNNNDPFFWIKGGLEPSKPIQDIRTRDSELSPKPVAASIRRQSINSGDTARAGLQPGWIRGTFILKEENLRKLKSLAHWERKGIKDILDEALTIFLKDKKIGPPTA